MKTIWKYNFTTYAEFDVPKDAQILDVQVQHNEATIWMLVETNNPKETRKFIAQPTGHELPDYADDLGLMEYVGTIQLHDGYLVFHIFEIK